MKIYKYRLPIQPLVAITVPKGRHKFVKVAEQHKGELYVWVLVSESDLMKELRLIIKGTGHVIEDQLVDHYIDSVCCTDGYVWHVFEEAQDDQE